jgi:hypothetical protein
VTLDRTARFITTYYANEWKVVDAARGLVWSGSASNAVAGRLAIKACVDRRVAIENAAFEEMYDDNGKKIK